MAQVGVVWGFLVCAIMSKWGIDLTQLPVGVTEVVFRCGGRARIASKDIDGMGGTHPLMFRFENANGSYCYTTEGMHLQHSLLDIVGVEVKT